MAIACVVLVLGAGLAGCGGSLDTRLETVRDQHEAGDFAGSIEPLREILSADPDHPEANYLLGLALLQTGQPLLAVFPLQRAAASPSFGVAAGVVLAAVLASRDDHEAAIAAADGVLAIAPDQPLALQVRAASNLRLGRDDAALADARRVVAGSGDALQARVIEVAALERLGRAEEAAEAERALADTARSQGEEAGEVRACVALAALYRELGDTEREGARIERCLARFPTDPFVLQQASLTYDAAGQTGRATRLWREAVAREPDDLVLCSLLAERLVRLGRVEEAEATLLAAGERLGDPRAFVQLARIHQQQRQLDRAVEMIDRAVALSDPPGDQLLAVQAELWIEHGDLEGAESLIARLSPPSRNLLQGRLLAERGEDEAALAAIETALAEWPRHAPGQTLAGRLADRLGRPDSAIAHYRAALEADAGATDAALALARLLAERGEGEAAAAVLQAQLERQPAREAEVRRLAARIAVERGAIDEARRQIAALERLPDQRLPAALERAALEKRTSGSEAAVRSLDRSGLDLEAAENLPALRAVAEELVSLGRGDEALERLRKARARQPGSPALFDAEARVLYRMGRVDDARAAFREALAIDPDHAPALAGLGRLMAAEQPSPEALALLDRAVAQGPPDAEATALLAARVADQLGRGDEAERRLRELVRAHPSNAPALNDLAWMLAQRDDALDEALALAQRAVGLDARAEMLDTLGWVRLRRGEIEPAIESLRRALESRPDVASTRYRLGLALERAGRTAEAREELERALDGGAFPEQAEARAALERLRSPG